MDEIISVRNWRIVGHHLYGQSIKNAKLRDGDWIRSTTIANEKEAYATDDIVTTFAQKYKLVGKKGNTPKQDS